MRTFEGSVNHVYPLVIQAILGGGESVRIDRPDALSSNTLELHPATISFTSPRHRLVTSFGRPVNVAFALAEVLWILAGRDDVAMLAHYNSTIGNYSDNGVTFNAPYGKRLRRAFGHDQIEDVIHTLSDDPSSRQATLAIWNPVDDKGWDRFPDPVTSEYVYTQHITKDRACNMLAHLMVRQDRLDWMQVVRSNDAVWGLPYNLMQFTHVMEYVAAYLDRPMGTYHVMIDSLHIYYAHMTEAERIRPFDLYAYVPGHSPMEVGPHILNTVLREEAAIRELSSPDKPSTGLYRKVGLYWYSVLCLLYAHRMYKDHRDEEAMSTLLHMPDQVYSMAQIRFYYQNRWYKHAGIMEAVRSTAEHVDVYDWITTRVEK